MNEIKFHINVFLACLFITVLNSQITCLHMTPKESNMLYSQTPLLEGSFNSQINNFLNGMTGLVQTSLVYGIDKNILENSSNLTTIQKLYFYLHNSIFLQMTVLFFFLLITFVYIHYKCKQYAESNLDKLIKQNSVNDNKGIIDEKLSMKEEMIYSSEEYKNEYFYPKNQNINKEEILLRIESKKFDQFLNLLGNNYHNSEK